MIEKWIVPCSVKFFDVVHYLDEHETIVWKCRSTINEKDEAYIYVGAPYSEIMFRCVVEAVNLSQEEIHNNSYAVSDKATDKTKYMRLRLVNKYEEGTLSLQKLREVGLGQTQVQARAPRTVVSLINEINRNI